MGTQHVLYFDRHDRSSVLDEEKVKDNATHHGEDTFTLFREGTLAFVQVACKRDVDIVGNPDYKAFEEGHEDDAIEFQNEALDFPEVGKSVYSRVYGRDVKYVDETEMNKLLLAAGFTETVKELIGG